MSPSRVRLTFAGACLLALTATACSSDAKSSDGAAATVAPTGSVAPSGTDTGAPTGAAALTISGNAFSAASVTAGTEFSITNNDSVGHTVTDDAGSFDISVPAGGTATLSIPDAGSYAIHCKIHGSMHGTITVA